MKFTFAMYDALIQAGIKPEAARRVVTALETDMTTLLATKQDVALLRKDIEKESLQLKIWLATIAVSAIAFLIGLFKFFLG